MPIAERSIPASEVLAAKELIREYGGKMPPFDDLRAVAPDIDSAYANSLLREESYERAAAKRAGQLNRQKKASR